MQVTRDRPRLYLALLLIVLIGGFGGAWAFSSTERNGYMDQDFGQWTAKMHMIRDCEVGDIAVIGDSRASAAIVPAAMSPERVSNLALTGATPIEGYFELQHILRCPVAPRVILLAYAPRQYEEAGWFWLHAARYGFFSLQELEEVRHAEQQVGVADLYKGAFGTEPPGIMKNWLYVHNFPPFNFASMLAARGFGRAAMNDKVRRDTLASGGQHLEGTAACAKKPGWEAAQAHFLPDLLIALFLHRLIDEASSRGIQVELLFPPISTLTAKAIAPAYKAEFDAYLMQLRHELPQVGMIGSAFPVMDDCSFGDEHHVNQKGADAFTRGILRLPDATATLQKASTGSHI